MCVRCLYKALMYPSVYAYSLGLRLGLHLGFGYNLGLLLGLGLGLGSSPNRLICPKSNHCPRVVRQGSEEGEMREFFWEFLLER